MLQVFPFFYTSQISADTHSVKYVSDIERIIAKYTNQSASVSGIRAVLNLIRQLISYVYLIYLVTIGCLTVSEFVFYFGIITGFSNWIVNLVFSYELLRTNGSYLMKTFMFALDRAWVFENIAYSHLKRGGIVIWDRYVDSAYAYRYAENYKTDIANFEYVKKINSIFPKPDLTIYLEISVLTSIKRAKKANRKEPYNEELLTKAKLYYDDIYRNNDKCVIINGEQSMTTIVEKIKHILEDKDERFRD